MTGPAFLPLQSFTDDLENDDAVARDILTPSGGRLPSPHQNERIETR